MLPWPASPRISYRWPRADKTLVARAEAIGELTIVSAGCGETSGWSLSRTVSREPPPGRASPFFCGAGTPAAGLFSKSVIFAELRVRGITLQEAGTLEGCKERVSNLLGISQQCLQSREGSFCSI